MTDEDFLRGVAVASIRAGVLLDDVRFVTAVGLVADCGQVVEAVSVRQPESGRKFSVRVQPPGETISAGGDGDPPPATVIGRKIARLMKHREQEFLNQKQGAK